MKVLPVEDTIGVPMVKVLIDEALGKESERIVAYDPSFITKSGKKTHGLDCFWNGCHRRSEKGLELATLAIVDIEKITGFALSTRQTEPVQELAKQVATASPPEASESDKVKKTAPKKGRTKKGKTPSKKSRRTYETDDETLIDQYAQQLREAHPFLRESETHMVVDGAFAPDSKKKRRKKHKLANNPLLDRNYGPALFYGTRSHRSCPVSQCCRKGLFVF